MGDGKLEKDTEGRGRSRGGIAIFIVVQESSEARAPTPCLIRQLLNPGGQTLQLRLYNIYLNLSYY
jgi:hypothetical protein